MAGQADGSVYVDTELDPQGFKVGSKELQSAVKSLGNAVKSLEPTFQKAIAGNVRAMDSFNAKAASLQSTIEELETKMEALGGKKLPTQEYSAVNAELQKLEAEIAKADEKKRRFLETGGSEDSAGFRKLEYDAARLTEAYDRALAKKKELEQAGNAYMMGSDTAEYQAMNTQLDAARSRLAEMRTEASAYRQEMDDAEASVESSASAYSSIRGSLSASAAHVSRAAGTVRGSLAAGLKAAASHAADMVRHLKSSKGAMGGLLSSVKKLVPALMAARGVMGILRKAVQSYLSANQSVANQLSSVWSNLGNLLGPIISRIANLVASAMSLVMQFLALLGISVKASTKAIDSAAGGASAATKDLKRQLASFDELNVLSKNEDSGGGGGGGGGSPGFDIAAVELPDWAKMIAEQLKNGEWATAATLLAEKLNEMVASVDWAGLGDKIGYYLNGALTFLATAIENFDWTALGADLATAFNHILYAVDWRNLGVLLVAGFKIAIEFLDGLVSTLDWEQIGLALSDCLTGAVNAISWTQLGHAFSTGVIGLLQAGITAVTTFDWAGFGAKIAQAIREIDWVGILTGLAQLIVDTVIGALQLLSGFITEIDWADLTTQLQTAFANTIQNVDWAGLISSALELLGAALGAYASARLQTVLNLRALAQSIVNAIREFFVPYMDDAGHMTIEGFFQGIWDAISGIADWIKTNIFEPFINGFKAAFGIASPSTVMAEQGGFIIEGLLQGITEAWHTITDFFDSVLGSLKELLSGAWESIKSTATKKWSALKSTISDKWEDIKSNTTSTVNTIKEKASDAWSKMKTSVTTALSTAKDKASSAWSSMKTTASTIGTNIQTSVKTAWTNVKNNIGTNLTNAKTSASTLWNSIKSTASSIGSNIAATASTNFTKVKQFVTTNLTKAKTSASSALNSMKSTMSAAASNMSSTMSSKFSSIYSTVSSKMSSIKSSISTGMESAKSSITGKMQSAMSTIQNQNWYSVGSNICSGIRNGINAGWSWLSSTVRNLASNLLSSAKSALGIRSPSRVFRDEVGKYISLGISEGIGETEDSVVGATESVADKAVAAASGVARAVTEEMQSGNYALGKIGLTDGLSEALDGFADRVTDSFTNLAARLQAIADGIGFPIIATRGIVPYSVAAKAGADVSTEADNEELISVMIQCFNQQTQALVSALERTSGGEIVLDGERVTKTVIDHVNKMTRRNGRSPILGVG